MHKEHTYQTLLSALPQSITEFQTMEQELPDLLHELCFRFDKGFWKDRMAFLQYLENTDFLSCSQKLRCASNMLYAYFAYMTENEKVTYLRVILALERGASIQNWGRIFELVGVLMKGAPEFMQDSLFNMVVRNLDNSISQDPSIVIYLCNCFRWVFWETSVSNRRTMLQLLNAIGEEQNMGIYTDSVVFTLETLKRLD